MKTLLHICCAPCSVSCVEMLREEGIEPTGFWYNPNIHPFTEYRARRNCLREYSRMIDMEVIEHDEYGLRRFIEGIFPFFDRRCEYCYTVRFEETAKYAAENGFDQFTSTLFVSPFQNHELMRLVAEKMAEKYGISYLHRDFSVRYKEGREKARELGLYMQKYCGCVFSEEERYQKKPKKKKQTQQV